MLAAAVTVTGCSAGGDELLLAGPDTAITVAIPDGWHQVINSADPGLPQMLAPVTCMGRDEVACATAIARIATFPAPSVEAAEQLITQAVLGGQGVTGGPTIRQGPGEVGPYPGHRHRFGFSNPGATLTAEVAAIPTGPTAPDPEGDRLFSVVLVWVSTGPDAPDVAVIDEIIGSVRIVGDEEAPR